MREDIASTINGLNINLLVNHEAEIYYIQRFHEPRGKQKITRYNNRQRDPVKLVYPCVIILDIVIKIIVYQFVLSIGYG